MTKDFEKAERDESPTAVAENASHTAARRRFLKGAVVAAAPLVLTVKARPSHAENTTSCTSGCSP